MTTDPTQRDFFQKEDMKGWTTQHKKVANKKKKKKIKLKKQNRERIAINSRGRWW